MIKLENIQAANYVKTTVEWEQFESDSSMLSVSVTVEARDGYYVTNDVTVGRRSLCLRTFAIFSEDEMSLIQSKCVYF